MFTGLIEERGRLLGRVPRGPGARIRVRCAMAPLVLGESIAVDGVCLTVDAVVPGGFEAEMSSETLSRTTLGDLAVGAGVNLERATPLGGRMGGHIVGGHVDAIGTVVARRPVGQALELHVDFPAELAPFLAEKGSVAINGVSLTINGASDERFHVVLVPHTRLSTALDSMAIGARVNLEADVLARYVARQLQVAGRVGAPPPPVHAAPPEGPYGPGPASASPSASPSPASPSTDAAWLERLGRAGYL